MKVKIQTLRDYDKDISPVVLFEGKLPEGMPVPRIGETLNVWAGWCCETVKYVNYNIEDSTALIELDTKPSADYFIEAVRIGVKQYSQTMDHYKYTDEI